MAAAYGSVMVGTTTDFDTVIELCSETSRRIVLGVLADQRESVTVRELADAIVEHEDATSPDAVSDETIKRIRTRLHHVHLPKLERAGLVEYNARRETVEPTSEFDRIERELAVILEADSGLTTSLGV